MYIFVCMYTPRHNITKVDEKKTHQTLTVFRLMATKVHIKICIKNVKIGQYVGLEPNYM